MKTGLGGVDLEAEGFLHTFQPGEAPTDCSLTHTGFVFHC